MKYVIFLIGVLFFCSCEKNDILSVNDSEQASVLKTRSALSDVKVENGYLVVTNFEALDSISDLLSQMTDLERVAWENKMKFESAFSHFNPYFDAFDALESVEEVENFLEQYKTILKIENDEECCDIDYPFQTRGYAYVLSKDGKIKLGNTLWIFKDDRKITILNATETRINNFKAANYTVENEGIFVDYYKAPKTRRGQMSGFKSLVDGSKTSGKRKYNWSLDLYKENIDGELRMMVGLFQQGKRKKAFSGYNVYPTTYSCCIDEIRFNNDRPIYSNLTQRIITSSEGKGGRYFKIIKSYNPNFEVPNFYIKLTHSSRGCSPDGPLECRYYESSFPASALEATIVAEYGKV